MFLVLTHSNIFLDNLVLPECVLDRKDGQLSKSSEVQLLYHSDAFIVFSCMSVEFSSNAALLVRERYDLTTVRGVVCNNVRMCTRVFNCGNSFLSRFLFIQLTIDKKVYICVRYIR